MRAKFFEKGKKKLPLNFCSTDLYKSEGIREPDGKTYYWDNFNVTRGGRKAVTQYLVDAKTGEKVIANDKHVGKPRTDNINGQKILSGNVKSFEKNSMFNEIADYARPFLSTISPINRFPIILRLKVYDTREDTMFSGGQRWDLENRFIPYAKVIHDLLTEKRADGTSILPDDCVDYITGPMQPMLYPIENPDERKLVLTFYKDNRPEILHDVEYQHIHQEKLL